MMAASALMTLWVNEYYNGGWAVVPLPPRSKKSPPDGTTGAAGVDLTREQLLERLVEDSNIGIRVPDSVIGIDVDAYGDKVGESSLNWLEYGPPGDEDAALGQLPATFVMTSRAPEDKVSGIRFYRVPPGLSWQQQAGPDIDIIRHAHRYAVAAPSIHPEGREYSWFTPDWVKCGVPRVSDLPELPEAWVAHLQRRTSSFVGGSWGSVTGEEMHSILNSFKPGPACACVKKWGQEALAAARRERGGAHNNLLTPVMMLVRQGLGDCRGAGEALHAAWRAYAGLPQQPGENHSADFAVMVSTTIPKAQADPWTCSEGAVLTYDAMKEPDPEPAEGEPAPVTRIKSGKAVLSSPTIPWLVDKRVHQAGLGQFYAPSYSGKTLVALSLALSVANGFDEWMGQKLARSGDVLYVAMEGGPAFQVHIDAWLKAHEGASLARFHTLDEEEVNLSEVDSWKQLMRDIELAEIKPVLVVFDTQIDVLAGVDEDSNRVMGPILMTLRKWAVENDLFALLVHHTPHGLERPRGASSQGGKFDMHALASQETGLKWTKVKGSSLPEATPFVVDPVTGSEGAWARHASAVEWGAARTIIEASALKVPRDKIIEVLGRKTGPDLNRGQLEKEVGGNTDTFGKALNSLINDGTIAVFKSGRSHHYRLA